MMGVRLQPIGCGVSRHVERLRGIALIDRVGASDSRHQCPSMSIQASVDTRLDTAIDGLSRNALIHASALPHTDACWLGNFMGPVFGVDVSGRSKHDCPVGPVLMCASLWMRSGRRINSAGCVWR